MVPGATTCVVLVGSWEDDVDQPHSRESRYRGEESRECLLSKSCCLILFCQ